MARQTRVTRFVRDEDGTLLVFFAISVITILGIVALSFDLGRRAATQTDMQSFVDNVVLAAAGELDGSANAITNATTAANSVISAANERLKAGTAGQDFTLRLDQIVFYENLPDIDTPGSFDVAQLSNPASPNYKYRLPPSDLGGTPDPTRANYVGVRLATVDVAWMFAGVFARSDLPDEAIGAVAVAGNSEWLCDAAPIMFCLPDDGAGGVKSLSGGQAAQLRSARQFSRWREGQFGFVQVAADEAGDCVGLTDDLGRQACLLNLARNRAACFRPDRATVIPAQGPLGDASAFEVRLDIFRDVLADFSFDGVYAPGPHSIKGRKPADPSDPAEICDPSAPSTDTMAFPLDECHDTNSCPDEAFGDGDWDRDLYVSTNYSLPPGWAGTNVDDPAFFDFPDPSLTRYRFYLLEIERARNGGVMEDRYSGAKFEEDNDGSGEVPDEYTSWDDFWPDTITHPSGLNPILPDALEKELDNGLPQCNLNASNYDNRRNRRIIEAAGINCSKLRPVDRVIGTADGIEVVDYYRLFLLSPVTNEGGTPPRFDLNVEVVNRVPPDRFGTHREVVQLYR